MSETMMTVPVTWKEIIVLLDALRFYQQNQSFVGQTLMMERIQRLEARLQGMLDDPNSLP